MELDLGGNYGTLQAPNKPIKIDAPDATSIYLHTGEDETKYDSFLKVISDLAQAFKFMPKYELMKYQYSPSDLATNSEYQASYSADSGKCSKIEQQMDPDDADRIWGAGEGVGYTNLDFTPSANEWNHIDGEDESVDSRSVLDEINNYFSWSTVKSAGGNTSYFDIAKNGISSYSNENAFNLMLSMLESKERVFAVYKSMFGEATTLANNGAVISKFDAFMAQFYDSDTQEGVDVHNLAILKMFFGMQTDFLNTLDAYTNCDTTWGKNFNDTLKTKVDAYIGTLSGDKKTKAASLEAMWFTSATRWDKNGTSETGSAINTSGTWANHVYSKIKDVIADEVARIMVAHIMNRSEQREYQEEKLEYENKKEEMMYQEIYLNKISAKKQAESKQLMNKLSAKSKANNAASKSKASTAKTTLKATATTAKLAAAKPSTVAVTAAAAKPAASSKLAAVSAAANQKTSANKAAAASSAAKTRNQAKANTASGANAANNSIAATQSKNQRRKTGNPV